MYIVAFETSTYKEITVCDDRHEAIRHYDHVVRHIPDLKQVWMAKVEESHENQKETKRACDTHPEADARTTA